jgi:hypothetical protein
VGPHAAAAGRARARPNPIHPAAARGSPTPGTVYCVAQ